MSVIAVTSSRTSPGATSLATGLALALSSDYERSLLIEADPAGGVLSLRFDLDVTPSLTTFGSDTRNGYTHDLVWHNTQDLRGTRCIPGPVDPRLARSWVERITPMLVEHLPTLGAPAIIDLGWIAEDGPSLPLAAAADATLVVTRPEIAEVQALLFQVRQLQAAGATVGLVTIGTAPNDPQEVAAVAGVPLVAVLPDDAVVAAALRGAKFAPNKFRRSLLWRTIGGIAASLVDPGLMMSRSASDSVVIDLSTADISAATPSSYAELTPEALSAPSALDEPPIYNPTPAPEPAPALVEPVAPPALAATEVPPRDLFDGDLTNDPVDLDPRAADAPTLDPNLFDETSRIVSQPAAELILDTGERRLLDYDNPTLIGRHGDCDIVLPDSQVSRRHGRLTRTVSGWHFADLGSRNGSVINGRPCTDAFLEPGDELYIGHGRLIFQTVPTRAHLRETENA